MALTTSEKLAHRDNGGQIVYKCSGYLAGVTYQADAMPLLGMNLVEDMHFETRGQVDIRLAGKIPASPYSADYVTITAEYVAIGGAVVDTEALGRYYVRNQKYDDLSDTTILRLFTADCFLTDEKFLKDDHNGSGWTYKSWIEFIITRGGISGVSLTPIYETSIPETAMPVDARRGLFGTSYATHVDNLLQRFDAKYYVNRNGQGVIAPRKESGVSNVISSTYINPGAKRLVKDISIEADRERWYNEVALRYWWSNGDTSYQVFGCARVASGDMHSSNAGNKQYIEEISGGPTLAEAQAAAVNMLKALTRRAELLLIKAVGMPWIKVGDRLTYDGRTWLIAKIQMDLITDEIDIQAELYTDPAPVESFTPQW
ncbi:hypothetical protein [Glutamicibacter sp. NPDC087673]|uniref:hypothetical protein n=1 Tax=Glutamicibacter sp. NPDC087673 TaxID=3363997 RepID=UPI0037FCE940